MKRIPRWLSDVFAPESMQDLDIAEIALAFNDQQVRTLWMQDILEEIKRINLEVDKRILEDAFPSNLGERRKALQFVLESVLAARRRVKQGERPNPRIPEVNLDRVTA